MRIGLIGAFGQLGTALQAAFASRPAGAGSPAGGWDVVPLGHREIEIADAAAVDSALSAVRPDCVINAAAYNLVDRAEEEPEAAYAVNSLGPRNLARWSAAHDVPLLHLSTDYVFGLEPGRHEPYHETDAPGPLGAYAASKLAGEYYVRAECPRHFVVRTCGLYGRARSSGKGNFVETMLRLGGERRTLRVVDDQHCTPTSAADLAQAVVALLGTEAYGLYHATNQGETTWCGFAREIFHCAGMEIEVVPITTAEFGAKARRPSYSVLDCTKLAEAAGVEMPPGRKLSGGI